MELNMLLSAYNYLCEQVMFLYLYFPEMCSEVHFQRAAYMAWIYTMIKRNSWKGGQEIQSFDTDLSKVFVVQMLKREVLSSFSWTWNWLKWCTRAGQEWRIFFGFVPDMDTNGKVSHAMKHMHLSNLCITRRLGILYRQEEEVLDTMIMKEEEVSFFGYMHVLTDKTEKHGKSIEFGPKPVHDVLLNCRKAVGIMTYRGFANLLSKDST